MKKLIYLSVILACFTGCTAPANKKDAIEKLLIVREAIKESLLEAFDTYQGVIIAPEVRCAPYDKKKHYSYSQSLEAEIVRRQGAIYGPYSDRCFDSIKETDIEHIVATAEAHDSGLCARTVAERKAFAKDPLNLTLAAPKLNQYEKVAKDAAEWLPSKNRCWYAQRVIDVKKKYSLAVDQAEADALESVLAQCTSTEMTEVNCQ